MANAKITVGILKNQQELALKKIRELENSKKYPHPLVT